VSDLFATSIGSRQICGVFWWRRLSRHPEEHNQDSKNNPDVDAHAETSGAL
jgi:hypothetical protein